MLSMDVIEQWDAYSTVRNTHKPTNYKSYTCVAYYKDGKMTEKYIYTKDIVDFIESSHLKDGCDWYISANTFKIKSPKRSKENLFSYRNFVIDIDFHTKVLSDDDYQTIEEFIIEEFNCSGKPYSPSTVVATGRGFQLWYTIEETSNRLGWMYDIVANRLLENVKNRLSDISDKFLKDTGSTLFIGFEADRCSLNSAGLFHLMNTVNQKNGRKALGVSFGKYNENDYTLTELLNGLPETEKEKREQELKNEKAKEIKLTKKEVDELKDSIGNDFRENRLKFLKYLAKSRKSIIGCRDKLLFLYYNYAKQIYRGNIAKKITELFNQSFAEPLPYKELKKIFGYIDRKIFLKFRNTTFLEFLDCSPKETKLFTAGFTVHHGKQNSERNNNKLAKEERDKKILKMKKEGKNNTCIAYVLGITTKTVQASLKKQNYVDERKAQIEKYKENGMKVAQIIVMMGISKKTYYNILKK